MATDVKLDAVDGNWIVTESFFLKHTGPDIHLDSKERRNGGSGPFRRALVHDPRDGLTINWDHDYTGGVTILDARVSLYPEGSSALPMNAWAGELRLVRPSRP